MALQGTLETFALADVLRLLASTKKTGVLRIEGDRGHGELAVLDGELVTASATGAPRAEHPAEVLFELLRYDDGSFVFDSDSEVAGRSDRRDNVEEALADAEEQLREWREIEAIVPSPTRLVTLVADRGDREITLNARQWGAVVAVGSGCTTLALSERLGVSELPATRLVRDLVELGAVEIGDEVSPALASEPAPEPAPAPAPVPEPHPAVVDQTESPSSLIAEPDEPSEPLMAAPTPTPDAPAEPASSFADAPSFIEESAPAPPPPVTNDAAPPAFAPPPEATANEQQPAAFAPPPQAPEAEDPIAGWNDDPDDGLSSFHDDHEPVPLFGQSEETPGPDDPFGPDPFQIPTFGSPEEARKSEEAAEMARQLANLSPRAQQAVAAAAAADSDEEREQAITQAENASEEPINRNLLLKYLSSVDE